MSTVLTEHISDLRNLSIVSDPGRYSRRENIWLSVCTKEGRVYNDQLLRELPSVPAAHPHHREWAGRKNSFELLKHYLQEKKMPLSILILGAGNGWMSAALAAIPGFDVTFVDLNMRELEQSARVFGEKKNLHFIYGDINDEFLPPSTFDVVVLAGSVQYFENLYRLVKKLLEPVKKGGEVHILDSPLYEPKNIAAAVEKSQQYFEMLGIPEMHHFYHHHLVSSITAFKPILMNSVSLLEKIKNRLSGLPASNPWFRIEKP
jgi:SAM-dependent methyltransferase